jgi:hypothetical protein
MSNIFFNDTNKIGVCPYRTKFLVAIARVIIEFILLYLQIISFINIIFMKLKNHQVICVDKINEHFKTGSQVVINIYIIKDLRIFKTTGKN